MNQPYGTLKPMDDAKLDRLGKYFTYHDILKRYDLTFEQFLLMNQRGDWEVFIRAQQYNIRHKKEAEALVDLCGKCNKVALHPEVGMRCLSRDNVTDICHECATSEAMEELNSWNRTEPAE